MKFIFKYRCPFEILKHDEFGFYARHPQTKFYLNSYGALSKSFPAYYEEKHELVKFIITRSDGKIYDRTNHISSVVK